MDTTATLSPILTGVANQFMRDPAGFVGARLFPPFSAALQSAKYYLFTAAELAQVPQLAKRAPGSAYARLKQSLSNDTYAAEDYGIEAPVPDEDRKKYAAYFDADISAVRRLVDTLRINHEQRVYARVTDPTVPTAAITVPWNDGASNPRADVDAAREHIRGNIGLMANLLVITQPMLNSLAIHPRLVDLFKYTRPGVLNEEVLAAYFGVDAVAVAKNVVATNNEGQAFVPADIWGNLACLAHVNPAEDLLVPNFGRTFYWNAFTSEITPPTGGTGPGMFAGGGGPELLQVMSYRDETVKSDIHRSEHYVDEKMTAAQAGFTLTGILQ
jgi:hypothetical protein